MRRKIYSNAVAMTLVVASSVIMLFGCGKTEAPEQIAAENTSSTEATAEKNQVETGVETPSEKVAVEGYNEAPMLADQVAAGKLPEVNERIPDTNNIFVETVDAIGDRLEIGDYGGSMNMDSFYGSWGLARPVLESIVRYNIDGSYYPNVIKDFDYSDNYKKWTFYLREGMKWSDGEPFTADDITFWYYMCHLNNYDGKKSGWGVLKEIVDGEEKYADLEKVDDYTVTWTFTKPKYPVDFIENGDFKWCWAPSHFLSDLIPESEEFPYVENPYWQATGLSDEKVLANAGEKNIEASSVKDLGKAISYYFWSVPGLPTLNSFVLSTDPEHNSRDRALCIMNRNAYYWKVDAEGNQLPYFDELHFVTPQEVPAYDMFVAGDIDIIPVAMRDIATTLGNLGDAVSLRRWGTTFWGSYQMTFNYTSEDKNYAELFANPNFREAMSICVDRKQISQRLSDGFMDPGQAAPQEGNVGYDADWMTKWTEYNVEKAVNLFDACGLEKGADGFYDFADGSDLLLTFTAFDGTHNHSYPVFEEYFEAAGIDCELRDMPVADYDKVIDDNDWIATIGPHTEIGGASLKDRAVPFVPIAQAAEWYGEYGTYYATNGAQGVEPTGDMAKLVELYEKWRSTSDEAQRDTYQDEIYLIHKANLWTIAFLKSEGTYELLSSKVHNYADNLISADCYQYANMVHFETLFKIE